MAGPLAGQTLTAAMLAQLANNAIILTQDASTTSPSLGAQADIAGCSRTFSTVNANVQCLIAGVFDFSFTATGNIAQGFCNIDGVSQAAVAESNALRACSTQFWVVTLSTPGSHTIKLRAAITGGTATSISGNTTLTIARLAA
jgi:hypothetical protein